MGIPLVIAERTGRCRRSLRRYRAGAVKDCPQRSYHDASAVIGTIPLAERAEASGDNWPHDDSRWPAACACGYTFAPEDHWQRHDDELYRMPDGLEFTLWGGVTEGPPGAMVRAYWYDGWAFAAEGEAWLVVLPDGGTWITTQKATDGSYWTVTGEPPRITVSPSIWHAPPHGWHGFIRDGHLEPA